MSTHTHVLEDGTAVTHTHEETAEHSHTHGQCHADGHSHTHDPKEVRLIVNRLAKAIGHLESVKRMVEDGKDCSEVLIQLAAVKSALNNTGKVILKQHISHCIVDAIETGDDEALENLNQAIDRLL